MDVLVVDDSRTMRLILRRTIRQAGYGALAITEAENGADALEKLRAGQPRLILSDWNMPQMSGLDFLKQIRATNGDVPFGFITSESSAAMREIAMSTGASFLICKPFTPEDIEQALAPILGGK
jgi:two-component system chemotaxis response regulator CheY